MFYDFYKNMLTYQYAYIIVIKCVFYIYVILFKYIICLLKFEIYRNKCLSPPQTTIVIVYKKLILTTEKLDTITNTLKQNMKDNHQMAIIFDERPKEIDNKAVLMVRYHRCCNLPTIVALNTS